jgi:site-specific DNA recombinase
MAEKVAIYVRVSSEEQVRGGTSLEVQQAACVKYCEERGYTVARVFVEEGESAKTANRTRFKELLAYCREQRDIKAVVVHKIDRFARNAADHVTVRTFLSSIGVTLRSVSEPIDDSYMGRFIEHVLSGVAELDNNIRADRSVKGMLQRRIPGTGRFLRL